jgi:hypothetical protein
VNGRKAACGGACACALALACMAPPAEAQRLGRPALSAARVTGEAVVGAYTAIGGYYIGRYVGNSIGDLLTRASENDRERLATAGAWAGAVVGSAVGVYGIGNIDRQTGSVPATLGGAAAGAAAGWLLDLMFRSGRRADPSQAGSQVRWLEASLESLLPSIGATIGFNSSRRFK